jgi:hypothetical protein
MQRLLTRVAVVCFVMMSQITVGAATARAAGWGEFWYRVHLDFYRVNCWPEPFKHADRQLTVSPLIIMTDRGWQLQNTLSDHFFETDGQVLNRAGQMKVRWIATQAPPNRRTVYVVRGPDAPATRARTEAIQRYLDQVGLEGARPEVFVTDLVPPGSSGEYFDEVDRQLKSSVPAPRLPEMQSTTGSGGGP